MTSVPGARPFVASPSVSLPRIAPVLGTGLLLGLLLPIVAILGAEVWVMAHNPTIVAMAGSDYRLYMDATSRWMSGGQLYPAAQLSGPYTDAINPILYPPQALVLFVPFTLLPTALWFAIPIALTGWIIAWQRPALWAWVAIAATVAAVPMLFLPYLSGTPTIWIAAFIALGTRWPALAVFVLIKPTLAPFALIGVRDRRWWLLAALIGLAGLVLLPLTLEWIQSVLNLTGERSGVMYSAENIPVMAVPIFAWLGSRRRQSATRRSRLLAAPALPSQGEAVPAAFA